MSIPAIAPPLHWISARLIRVAAAESESRAYAISDRRAPPLVIDNHTTFGSCIGSTDS